MRSEIDVCQASSATGSRFQKEQPVNRAEQTVGSATCTLSTFLPSTRASHCLAEARLRIRSKAIPRPPWPHIYSSPAPFLNQRLIAWAGLKAEFCQRDSLVWFENNFPSFKIDSSGEFVVI